MPIYEYQCRACKRRSSIFFRSLAVVESDPACPACGARALERLMSRVRMLRGSSSASREDAADEWGVTNVHQADPSLMYDNDWYGDDDTAGTEDEEDVREFAREAREMARMMGEPLDEGFETALQHIEQGADPDDVFGELDEREAATTAAPEDEPPTA